MYRPVRTPLTLRMLASVAAVDPLPLVPAISTEANRFCGSPRGSGQHTHVVQVELAARRTGGRGRKLAAQRIQVLDRGGVRHGFDCSEWTSKHIQPVIEFSFPGVFAPRSSRFIGSENQRATAHPSGAVVSVIAATHNPGWLPCQCRNAMTPTSTRNSCVR